MTEKVTRRRRRRLLVPLLGVGATVWFVRRRLDAGQSLDAGWPELPPVSWPDPPAAPVAQDRPVAEEPVVQDPPVAEEPAAVTPEPVAAPEPVVAPAPVRTAVPAATAVASVTAPALSEAPFGPGSVRALADGTSPEPDFTVKGKTATKVFHGPGGAYYTRTRADVWFRTAADAEAAGFTERGPRRHR